jgi:hypothetical protein
MEVAAVSTAVASVLAFGLRNLADLETMQDGRSVGAAGQSQGADPLAVEVEYLTNEDSTTRKKSSSGLRKGH